MSDQIEFQKKAALYLRAMQTLEANGAKSTSLYTRVRKAYEAALLELPFKVMDPSMFDARNRELEIKKAFQNKIDAAFEPVLRQRGA